MQGEGAAATVVPSEASVAAGTTITYKIYGRVAAANPGTYVQDAWGEGGQGKLTIMEIAP